MVVRAAVKLIDDWMVSSWCIACAFNIKEECEEYPDSTIVEASKTGRRPSRSPLRSPSRVCRVLPGWSMCTPRLLGFIGWTCIYVCVWVCQHWRHIPSASSCLSRSTRIYRCAHTLALQYCICGRSDFGSNICWADVTCHKPPRNGCNGQSCPPQSSPCC